MLCRVKKVKEAGILQCFCIEEKQIIALQYARLPGSLTLEAALVTPLLLFFVLVFLHLFLLLGAHIQVSAALQYTARSMAASYTDADEPGTAEGYLTARCKYATIFLILQE